MTEPTADVPTAPERDDLTAAPRESSEPTDQSGHPGTSGQGEQVDGGPAPAIIVLTEEALKPVDVDKIIALHQDEDKALEIQTLHQDADAAVYLAKDVLLGDEDVFKDQLACVGAAHAEFV